jgi:hypothetical protein
MHVNAAGYGAEFRAHLKSHKVIVPTVLGATATHLVSSGIYGDGNMGSG